MSKIREKKDVNNKIKNKAENLNCDSKKHIAISYDYITKNKRYNFKAAESIEYVPNNVNVYKDFTKKLLDLINGNDSFESMLRLRKQEGFEKMEYGDLNFVVEKDKVDNTILTGDSNIFIIRFGSNNKNARNGSNRAIFYKSKHCKPVLHLLGFDFDFSAYDHGDF